MDAMSETQWIEKKLSEKTGTIVKLSPRHGIFFIKTLDFLTLLFYNKTYVAKQTL